MRTRLVAVVLTLAAAACGGSADDGPRTKTFGGDRPVDLVTPMSLTEGKQYPLIVVLHGFGASGFAQAAYFHVRSLVDADEAFYLAPDGTTNSGGMQFWNADPACCDFEGQNPDDVGYIGSIVEDALAEWPMIDPDRVFLIGHSNGGYMSYRMACERADLFSAIVSLAGNATTNAATCTPSQPVSVLHMHGTADLTVPFSSTVGTGAVESVTQWAAHDGCGTSRSATVELDLDTTVIGAETHGESTAGCPSNVAVELWRLEGSGHIPLFDPVVAPTLLDWLTAHAR